MNPSLQIQEGLEFTILCIYHVSSWKLQHPCEWLFTVVLMIIFCCDLMNLISRKCSPVIIIWGYPGNIHLNTPTNINIQWTYRCRTVPTFVDHFPNWVPACQPWGDRYFRRHLLQKVRFASKAGGASVEGGHPARCSVRGMWWVWWGRALETRPGVDAGGVTSWLFFFITLWLFDIAMENHHF